MKKCSKCKIEKSLEMFSKNRSRNDGLSHRCKECVTAYYRTEKGKAMKARGFAKYYASANGREKTNIKNARYNKTPQKKANNKKYNASQKGKERRLEPARQ